MVETETFSRDSQGRNINFAAYLGFQSDKSIKIQEQQAILEMWNATLQVIIYLCCC